MQVAIGLRRAYAQALYRVDGPFASVVLRVGDSAEGLTKSGIFGCTGGRATVRFAAIVTAHNPASRLQSPFRNRAANLMLERRIRRLGFGCFPSTATDPHGDWPDEPGFCIVGCGLEAARRLAADFGQAAFIRIRSTEASNFMAEGPTGVHLIFV